MRFERPHEMTCAIWPTRSLRTTPGPTYRYIITRVCHRFFGRAAVANNAPTLTAKKRVRCPDDVNNLRIRKLYALSDAYDIRCSISRVPRLSLRLHWSPPRALRITTTRIIRRRPAQLYKCIARAVLRKFGPHTRRLRAAGDPSIIGLTYTASIPRRFNAIIIFTRFGPSYSCSLTGLVVVCTPLADGRSDWRVSATFYDFLINGLSVIARQANEITRKTD